VSGVGAVGVELSARDHATGARGPRRQWPLPVILVAPIVAFEAVFVLYPILRAITTSLHVNRLGETQGLTLENFRELLHDPGFWSALRVTFEFTVAIVLIWVLLGLAVALLMNWAFPGRAVARALLALPWAIPDIPIVMTFLVMLDPHFGVVNRFASWVPGASDHTAWLTTPPYAFIALIVIVGWKGFPFYALVLLSSLQTIPDELYEAAMVDGAGPVRRFRAVTLPAIAPALSLLAVLAFVFAFQQFALIYLSTGGGPGVTTTTLAVQIYNQAFSFFNYNYASAMAVVGLVIAVIGTLGFIFVGNRLTPRRRTA
jgi:multiple sugar transport system permease protein